jgi:hypothetical protein
VNQALITLFGRFTHGGMVRRDLIERPSKRAWGRTAEFLKKHAAGAA